MTSFPRGHLLGLWAAWKAGIGLTAYRQSKTISHPPMLEHSPMHAAVSSEDICQVSRLWERGRIL